MEKSKNPWIAICLNSKKESLSFRWKAIQKINSIAEAKKNRQARDTDSGIKPSWNLIANHEEPQNNTTPKYNKTFIFVLLYHQPRGMFRLNL